MWDVRRKQPNTATFVPADKPSLERPKLGKWIGAVSMSSDWIVSCRFPFILEFSSFLDF